MTIHINKFFAKSLKVFTLPALDRLFYRTWLEPKAVFVDRRWRSSNRCFQIDVFKPLATKYTSRLSALEALGFLLFTD